MRNCSCSHFYVHIDFQICVVNFCLYLPDHFYSYFFAKVHSHLFVCMCTDVYVLSMSIHIYMHTYIHVYDCFHSYVRVL